MLFIPSSAFCINQKPSHKRNSATYKQDSTILSRMFSYQRNFIGSSIDSAKTTYIKSNTFTLKRNLGLMLVPTMYAVSKGNRNYVGESFGVLKFKNFKNLRFESKVEQSTIPHSRKILPHLIYYIMPNLYGETLFRESILSPFNKANHKMYKYNVTTSNFGRAIIYFKPIHTNTQLVWGYAMVNTNTGRIIRTNIRGEFDMIKFDVRVDMGYREVQSVFPLKSDIVATFSLLGNKITSEIKTSFDDTMPLPDSVNDVSAFIDSIRPHPLSMREQKIYNDYFKEESNNAIKRDTTIHDTSDTVKVVSNRKKNKFYDIAWDVIGDYMIGSLKAQSPKASIKMSPLVNPLYLSYSRRKGLSYKMKIGGQYNFSRNANVSLNPIIGYNFKINRLFINAPLRYTYDIKHHGWLELVLQNGNVITNAQVLKKIEGENRDTVDFSGLGLDYFNDYNLSFMANRKFSPTVELQVGVNYHVRDAVNKEALAMSGLLTSYRSFAPSFALTLSPFRRGPVFTLNYERSIKDVMRSNTEYERIEIDGVYNKKLQRLRQINLRLGGGFYTNKSSEYFVDFENFHENYLPGGWDDEWAGDFQLLNSDWYNASRYYVRGNASYESPMMILSRLPLLGNFVETEKFYASFLEIEHTRPYTELGYGFTTRFVSVGMFASFLNGDFNEFGTKFTFELFRKW